MKHHVKPIMGRQLPTPTPTATPPISNNLQEECIRVNKVYDWVVLANSYRNKIALPDDCQALVDAAIRAGQDITLSCVEPVSPGPTCRVVSIRRRTLPSMGPLFASVSFASCSEPLCSFASSQTEHLSANSQRQCNSIRKSFSACLNRLMRTISCAESVLSSAHQPVLFSSVAWFNSTSLSA